MNSNGSILPEGRTPLLAKVEYGDSCGTARAEDPLGKGFFFTKLAEAEPDGIENTTKAIFA
ncbi:hypothetical protein [Gracilibacillus sp. YIM 98692]|uniref:hypothetical protein n=1 Tax=Gracilibacillus sp. YIM 98692 TaxID=2663532 RepID=UPI0013D6D66C|nr:hypothetical protein [Gracilibacillus sp. YIM 98692]